ncbi:S-layer homology domain-containing protein [Sporosarcina highlanderae]|uniref:S-layer homology domain-containing protein n=1 Tax=Sporosarcina highlanderae TaxID=3035916 RepID=A0ABT8JRW5_9BACL|nr:S-layer homology domain-containing protein [Sporosarcina highlanderae]MDN4607901.1 S-layer homology domain-containing protein [Sporosarcina highlanderae]
MKKIFSIFIAVLIVFGCLPQQQTSASTFSDVPTSHGFYKEVSYLLEKGVISPSKKYGVNDKVTRAEVALMVSKAVGLEGTKKPTKFKDVPASHNESGYIDSAVKAGVISGFSDGTFRPNEFVDRGQMAMFLARAFDLKVESGTNFKDMSPSVASYSSVKKIIHARITSGFSDNTFRPAEKLTRGQISAFLARAMQGGNVAIPKPPSKPSVDTTPKPQPPVDEKPVTPTPPVEEPSEPEKQEVPLEYLTAEPEFVNAFLAKVNEERASKGVQNLTLDTQLGYAANFRAKDMATNNYMGHYSPTYGYYIETLTDFGINYSMSGEVVNQFYNSGDHTGNATVSIFSFFNSQGHYEDLMYSGYDTLGIGYQYSPQNENYYVAVLLIKK